MTADLRLGRWQDVLADVDQVDALIVDAPYSEATHVGHRDGVFSTNKQPHFQRREINYAHWTPDDVAELVTAWAPRARGWFVALTSHDLAPVYADHLSTQGRYVFAPLPWVHIGGRIRLSGDGPSSWTCWIVVARPKNREMQRWGTLPGAYISSSETEKRPVVGGKPTSLMRSLIRDYTRPGDLVCDPCAGGGTTLLAALLEGRRAIGAEMDPKHYEIARKRLARGFTPPLFVDDGGRRDAEQLALDEVEP